MNDVTKLVDRLAAIQQEQRQVQLDLETACYEMLVQEGIWECEWVAEPFMYEGRMDVQIVCKDESLIKHIERFHELDVYDMKVAENVELGWGCDMYRLVFGYHHRTLEDKARFVNEKKLRVRTYLFNSIIGQAHDIKSKFGKREFAEV